MMVSVFNKLMYFRDKKIRKSEEIILCGWPHKYFDPLSLHLHAFPKVKSLTIEYSSFTDISYEFPEISSLKSINISWTNLSSIDTKTFKRVNALEILDLRWNQLVQLEGPLLLPKYFQRLYLAGTTLKY